MLQVYVAILLLTAAQTNADEANDILKTAGFKGGLIVHVGCGDGKLTVALRANDGCIVHGLDAHVTAARQNIQAAGLYGPVSVEKWSGERLPYVDNLVNLVVTDNLGKVPMAEVMRVLAPLGVACVKANGQWTRSVKPWPKEIDEWTYYLHGPDNNAVAQDHVAGAPAGVKNNTTVFTAVDLLPTLCAAAGVNLLADYHGDGENLLDAFDGKSISRKRPIFWEWLGAKTEPDWWPRLAVREGDWKLAMTEDAKRVELHQLLDNRAELKDVAKDHPDIVARLSKLALDWKATLPEKPNPACLTTVPDPVKTSPPKTGAKGVTSEARAKVFDRWDTDHDGFLTLDEYKAGLKGQENLEARFKNFDKNGDGKLTSEEFVIPSGK